MPIMCGCTDRTGFPTTIDRDITVNIDDKALSLQQSGKLLRKWDNGFPIACNQDETCKCHH